MSTHKMGGLRRLVSLAMLLVMAGTSFLFSGELRADDDQTAYGSWVGTWDTVADGKDKFAFTLQEARFSLTGTYTPGNGQVRGRIYEGVLNLYWSQDGSATGVKLSGSAQLKLSADGKSFTGTSKTDGQTGDHSWSGTLRPGTGVISFAGDWGGALGNTFQVTMTLTQTGSTVTGSGQAIFPGSNPVAERFTIAEGKVTDRTLTFKVYPANGTHLRNAGIEKLVLLEDGKTIQGTLGAMPAVAGRVISFSGVWKGAFNNTFQLTLTLSQTADTVTGGGEVIFPGSSPVAEHFTIGEGKVNDRTLTFKTLPANGNHLRYAGIEKFELLADGKTIQGTLGALPAVAGYVGQVDSGSKAGPVSFIGTWNVVSDGGEKWVFNITPFGSDSKTAQVRGTFYRESDVTTRYDLKTAYVTGNKLSFDAQLNYKYTGKTGRFVMDEGGKSFTGTYGNNTMTGTLAK